MSSGGTLLDAGAGAGASQSTAMRDPLLGRPTSLGLGRDKILPLPTLFERVGRMVQDAVHGHNNQHRYDATGLRVARVLNSMWYKALILVAIVANLGLAVLEKPSRLRAGNEHNRELVDVTVTCLIELVTLLMFAVDVWLHIKYYTWPVFRHRTWPFAKLCFVVGALVNLCLGWAIPAFPMFQRLARPIFLVANYRNIQKIFGSMVRTAPEVARVTVLLLLHITLHSAAAYTLFGGMSFDSCTAPRTTSLCSPFTRNCTDYFATFVGSFNNLFVLLTTANYPDVMMPAYICAQWSSLFFIEFLVIGLFFVMSLILAVAYSTFQTHTKDLTLKQVTKAHSSMDMAYNHLMALEETRAAGGVTYGMFTNILKAAHVTRHHAEDAERVLFRSLDRDRSGILSRADFRRLYQLCEIRIRAQYTGSEKEYACNLPARAAIRELVTKSWFSYVFEALVFGNCVLIVAQFNIHDAGTLDWMNIVQNVLLYLFILEIALKLYGLGIVVFVSDLFNVLDFIVIGAAVIGVITVGHGTSEHAAHHIDFLRALRLLRTLRAVKAFHVTLRTFGAIIPTFSRYVVVCGACFYSFAIVGMMAFAGSITKDDPKLLDVAFGEAHYWLNTFNSLHQSSVTLFELLIVNNWAITMDGHCIAVGTRWAALYFYAFYFVAVLLVVNIVVAFLIDDFVVTQGVVLESRQNKVAAWKKPLLEAAHELNVDVRNWVITRPLNQRRVHEMLFAAEIAELVESSDAKDSRDASASS